MKKQVKFSLYLLSLLFFTNVSTFAQQREWIGIPSETLNYCAASQQKSQWCWAATIEMVLRYYGLEVSQEAIVARSYGTDAYGNLPDLSASYDLINANLNNWSVDANGNSYKIEAQMGFGAPNPDVLFEELAQGSPIIVGYETPQGTGHAVVITAAGFVGDVITDLVVRDPFPSNTNIQNLGRVVYDARSFASRIEVYWLIRVYY